MKHDRHFFFSVSCHFLFSLVLSTPPINDRYRRIWQSNVQLFEKNLTFWRKWRKLIGIQFNWPTIWTWWRTIHPFGSIYLCIYPSIYPSIRKSHPSENPIFVQKVITKSIYRYHDARQRSLKMDPKDLQLFPNDV